MVRTQVQLPEEDLRELRRLAKEQHVSVSAMVRRGVKCVIEQEARPSREELWERASQAVGRFRSGRTDISRRHDEYLTEVHDE
jgi:Arc/MetJ-type ribon-helix-helix transcriptional regulator